MEKEKNKTNNSKGKLYEGDKIFYFDGISQWTIETVESIDRANKKVTLSNNAIISRYPSIDGNYIKEGIRKPLQYITKLTPELDKLRSAIICKRRIEKMIFEIQQNVLQKADLREWMKWSTAKQNKLIIMAGHLAKGLAEVELNDEELEALNKQLEK